MDSLDFSALAQLFDEITAFLESISDMSYSFTELLYAFLAILTVAVTVVGAVIPIVATVGGFLVSVLTAVGGFLTTAITTGVGLVVLVVTLIIYAILSVILYFLRAIPVFIIGKKMKSGCAWLAWIPLFQRLFCLYVLMKSSSENDFKFVCGKIKIKEKIYSFLIYLALYLLGDLIITVLIGTLSLIPAVGQVLGCISILLYLIPGALCAFIEYIYFRDVLDTFKPDRKSNCIHATLVTLMDYLITGDLARTIYLFTIMKRKPIVPNTAPTEIVPMLQQDVPEKDSE